MVGHEIKLQGLGLGTEGSRPTILARTDPEFIPALLAELKQPDAMTLLANKVAKTRLEDTAAAPPLKLMQPVHRTFNIAVLSARCDVFGDPRLDPAQIESSGLVVRRLGADGPLGWMHADGVIHGWRPLSQMERQDPSPGYRRPLESVGHPEVNRQLALLKGVRELLNPLTETTHPLFVAPPDVCAAAGKTILYGLIPVTSSEASENPPLVTAVARQSLIAGLADLFPSFFVSGSFGNITVAADTLVLGDTTTANTQTLTGMLPMLIDFGAFAETDAANTFIAELNTIQLTIPNPFGGQGHTLGAGTLLKNSAHAFQAQQDRTAAAAASANSSTVTAQMIAIPVQTTWTLTKEQGTAIRGRLADLLLERRATLFAGERRFDARNGRYQLQAFIRLRQPDGCPPKTIWSEPSEPYAIAPWYDSSGVPPVPISLPNPFDRAALKNAKPNVAFAVPSELAAFIQANSPGDIFGDGPAKGAAGVTLDWICSFNIPFITICAFIVLSIFLALLDIVFQWMLFIRICIPIPIPSTDNS